MIEWAEEELNRLLINDDTERDHYYQEKMNNNILELLKVFATQGHSHLSASYARHTLNRLLTYKPLTPLTGEDDEWSRPYDSESTQQNRRCSSVFRTNYDNSTALYLDGKVFSDDGGETWYTNRDSSVKVTFPFVVPEEPERIILN